MSYCARWSDNKKQNSIAGKNENTAKMYCSKYIFNRTLNIDLRQMNTKIRLYRGFFALASRWASGQVAYWQCPVRESTVVGGRSSVPEWHRLQLFPRQNSTMSNNLLLCFRGINKMAPTVVFLLRVECKHFTIAFMSWKDFASAMFCQICRRRGACLWRLARRYGDTFSCDKGSRGRFAGFYPVVQFPLPKKRCVIGDWAEAVREHILSLATMITAHSTATDGASPFLMKATIAIT